MRKFETVRLYLLLAVAILSLTFLTTAAEAYPIEYLFSGAGVSGTINPDGPAPIDFNNAKFGISIFGDTSNVVIDALGPIITGLTGTMALYAGDLSMTYSGSFLESLYVYVDPLDELVGFGTGTNFDSVTGDALDQLNLFIPGVGLDIYALNGPFGPFEAVSINNFFGTALSFGSLVLDDINSASFAVPEPATMFLLGAGLIGLVGFRRKFKG